MLVIRSNTYEGMNNTILLLSNYLIPRNVDYRANDYIYDHLDRIIIALKAVKTPIISLIDDTIECKVDRNKLLDNELHVRSSNYFSDYRIRQIIDKNHITEVLIGGFNVEASVTNCVSSVLDEMPSINVKVLSQGIGSHMKDQNLAEKFKSGYLSYWELLSNYSSNLKVVPSEMVLEYY